MTVADLIAELQRLPQHLPVKTVIATAEQCFAEGDAVTLTLHLSDLDALPVDTVRAAGGYVLITGA